MPRFGDELARILASLGANWGDVDFLRTEGNNLHQTASLVRSWGSPDGDIMARSVHADNLTCGVGPHDTIGVRAQADFATATGVEIDCTFDALRARTGHRLSWDASAPTVIACRNLAPVWTVRVSGVVSFASNATGYRWVVMAAYDSLGTIIHGTTMACLPAASGIETTLPYAGALIGVSGTSQIATLKLRVGQTSGGNLNVIYANMFVELISSEAVL